MRRTPLLLGVLAASLLGFAAPAAATDQPVAVQDEGDAFFPARVAVKPGDTVTWTNDSTVGEEHNVKFEDGSFTHPNPPLVGRWTAGPRTFPTLGKYPYFCEVHGGPGGAGMAGVVYVNALGKLPPLVAFSITSNPAQTGQTVAFNAAASSSSAGTITNFHWDFGDGSPATDTGTTPTTSHSYASPGMVNVKLTVSDNNALSDDKSISLQIDAPPPPPPPPPPPATTRPNPVVVPPNPVAPAPNFPPPVSSAHTTPPSVSAYGVTNKVFAPGKASTPTTGRAAKKAATGTAFQYRLSEAATVKIDLQQLLPGRTKGKTCVKSSAKLRRAKKCLRVASQGTLTRTSRVGANTVAFTGRVGNKTLRPGNYQAVLTATDAAGNTSARKTLAFRVVRA